MLMKEAAYEEHGTFCNVMVTSVQLFENEKACLCISRNMKTEALFNNIIIQYYFRHAEYGSAMAMKLNMVIYTSAWGVAN